MGSRYTAATTLFETASTGGSGKPALVVTYSGGVDNSAPLDGFVPYSGFFLQGGPEDFLHYSD